MKIKSVYLRNFRRLENIEIDFEPGETFFVGPNNSGKTSATKAFELFLVKPDFKVYDFSVSRIRDLDSFGFEAEAEAEILPSIEMDLWFSINPEIEFGRVSVLIPNLTSLEEVGIRLKYCIKDAKKLKSEYLTIFPPLTDDDETIQKSLSHYLSLQGNLRRHFQISYFALEKTEDGMEEFPLEPKEGKRVLSSLVRVDFVKAQRDISEQGIGRSDCLSAAFATFYKKNLEQADVSDEANRVIDENNQNLTKHYEEHFVDLMTVIKELGAPAVNDRQMKIISSLSPEAALQGNTSLLYVDPKFKHELPEAYNGLGFKNLIYMAIQISHFHLQWMKTENSRPLCQILFIEEPEVHLHAQVQQTFVSNIWSIVEQASTEAGEEHMIPQLGITTHSSHILELPNK